ncbi:unnamed protein product [Didymodactylos carnosus]|uniref:Alpha-2-macroglobulin domain-containing protein n=1 Tax=Didymodactylos carnosus TaxID=1234261 RepID=A0A8S2INR4_9BILA|nr:unnamed protein product [Didymodactylos carnosus]CAF3766068.1 unnamed protein product [Didymodactylos carnosus]
MKRLLVVDVAKALCYIQWSLAENSYLIVLPKLLKVDWSNEISISVANVAQPVEFSFELISRDAHLRTQITVRPSETKNVTLALNRQFPIGVGELIIQATGGLKFTERREVLIYDDRYVLLVQTSSTTYRPNDTVEIRVVATNENMIPIENGEMTIEIYDSRMKLVTDYKRVQIRNGLSDVVQYCIPQESQQLALGNWLIAATIETVTSSVEILVSRPTQSGFDMKVLLPNFLLRTEKLFRGFVEIADDFDRPIFGRATVSIGQITEQDLVSGDRADKVMSDEKQSDDSTLPAGQKTTVIEVDGRSPMNFDLVEMFGIDLSKALALTVYVSVKAERFSKERVVKYIVPIFRRDVIYDIRPLDFYAGEKNEYEILAKRPDGKPAKMEEMLVNVTMLFETDAPKTIEIRDLYTRGRTDIGFFNFDIPANCIGLTPMGEDGKQREYRTRTVPLIPLPKRRENSAKLSVEMVADKTGLHRRSSSSSEQPISTMLATVGRPAYFYVQLLPMKSFERYEPFPMTYIVMTNGKITSSGTFTVEPTRVCTTMAPRSIQPEQEDPSKPPQCVFNSTLEILMTREMLPYSTLLVYGFNPSIGISVAETYRFSVDGLFKNNLTMNMSRESGTEQQTPSRDESGRMVSKWDLLLTGLPESTVGVNVISYDAITQALPNDITKERLLRYLISYERLPLIQGLPISGGELSSDKKGSESVNPRGVEEGESLRQVEEGEFVSLREVSEGKEPSSSDDNKKQSFGEEEELMRKRHHEHFLRALLKKISFGLRQFHTLETVEGDDAYITTNMERLYGDKRRGSDFGRRQQFRNKQYRVDVGEDWNVQVGMPQISDKTQASRSGQNDDQDDEASQQRQEGGDQMWTGYGTREWYERMNKRVNLLSREAFILMHSGMAFVTDYSTLMVPKEMHHMNYTIINNYRERYLMTEKSPREAARKMLEEYISKVDSSLIPPPMMLEEHTRATYYHSILFNRTQLDRSGQGRLRLPSLKPYTTWLATGFSLNAQSGLGVAQPTLLRTPEGLYIMAETPKEFQMGEHCTFSYAIANLWKKSLSNVVVRVKASPDYDIMEQQGGKIVPMSNDYIIKVPAIKPETTITQSIVIVPKRAGVFNVIFEVESEFGGDCELVPFRVWAAGMKPTSGEFSEGNRQAY